MQANGNGGTAPTTRAVGGPPARLLVDLAREGNAVVGGSFLARRYDNVYNSFVLALPDGSTRRHDKDDPTFWENCYYIGGNDDGVLPTPQGNIGAALCWEFIRSRTAARLKGKVDIVVGGSGWWGGLDSGQPGGPSADFGLEIMKAAPSRFARMLGVPVVHAGMRDVFWGSPGLTRAGAIRLATWARLRSLTVTAAFSRGRLAKKAKA